MASTVALVVADVTNGIMDASTIRPPSRSAFTSPLWPVSQRGNIS
jgi:hypothetical protein